MATGHHAAVSAGVDQDGRWRSSVTERSACPRCWLRDGSVRSGSSLSAATPRARVLAREFGATDVVAERGETAIEAVAELTGGIGMDAALECVGTARVDLHRVHSRPGGFDGRDRGGTSR